MIDQLVDEATWAMNPDEIKRNLIEICAEILTRILVASEVLLYGEPKS